MCGCLWVKAGNGLDYYATAGPMTDLSSCDPSVFAGLPEDPAALTSVVRRCLIAGAARPGRDDPQIRRASDMVERIISLDPSPLVERREPEQRFIGCCRHFATLACALIRRLGVPSRVRAGWAAYFHQGALWVDHWILEYWSAGNERWVRTDAQWSERWFATAHPGRAPEDVLRDAYLSGAEMWQRCRGGDIDADRCRMGDVNFGIGEVRGSVLYDFAALIQAEMLPWDVWGQMKAAYDNETDASYDELLARVADVTAGGDVAAIRNLYERTDDLRVPVELLTGRPV